VTVTQPPNSTWASGPHWHESHTEFLQIVHGTALVTLNKTTRTFTPEDGIITVPRFASHEWRRANSEGEELVVKEWTGPVDGEKQIFFRNLSSVILDVRKMDRLLSGGSPGSFSLYFRDWTTIPFF